MKLKLLRQVAELVVASESAALVTRAVVEGPPLLSILETVTYREGRAAEARADADPF